MNIREIAERIDSRIVTDRICINKSDFFEHAFASDLMSDVLRLTAENTVLITGLCNVQTIRTAEMAEIKLIILARGKHADKLMIELAEENDICIIETDYSVFRVSGELYNNGIKPIY
jgi:predicted transcriptional regulator